MPIGIYQHKPNQGYQKGHKDFVSKEGRKRQSEKIKGKLPKNWYPQIGFKKGHLGLGWKIKKHHTEKSKRKMSESAMNIHTGLNNGNWKGGISFEPYSVDWTETLRRSIRERDKYNCKLCSKNEDLIVHHIDYDKKNCNPDNLITLCRSCNSKVNKNRNYWTNYFNNIMGIV